MIGQQIESGRFWHSALKGMSLLNPPQNSEAIWTHRDCDSMHKICTSSNQTKSQHGEGEVDTKSNTHQEVISNCYRLGKRKLVFSSRVSLGISTTFQGRVQAQEYLIKIKQTPFCVCVWEGNFCFGIFFVLLVFVLILFLFYFFFGEEVGRI